MGMHLERSREDVAQLTLHRDLVHRQHQEFSEETEIAESALENMDQVDDEIASEYEAQKEEAYNITLEQLNQANMEVKAQQNDLKIRIDKDMADLETAINKYEQNSGNEYYKHLKKAIDLMKEHYREYQKLLEIVDQAMDSEILFANTGDVEAALTWNRAMEQVILQKEQQIMSIPSLLTTFDAGNQAMQTYNTNRSQIEDAMRNGTAFSDEGSKRAVENLHSLLTDRRTDRDMTVYAPMTGENFKGLGNLSDEELVGKILADGAFLHTSLQEKNAQNGDGVLVINLPKGSAAGVMDTVLLDDNAHTDPLPGTDINLNTKLGLQNGVIERDIFKSGTDPNPTYQKGLKLEEINENTYDYLKTVDPAEASRMLTDYNARHIPAADWHDAPKDIGVGSTSLHVTDSELKAGMANVVDDNGNSYVIYPNPMTRVNNMFGQQGKNNIGMQEDCGIASTAKAINDLYGTTVTTENRLGNYARDNGLCEWNPFDAANSGGTWESTVRELYNANGLEADAYTKSRVPNPWDLAERIKGGEAATVAVCSDIFWGYDPAIHTPGNYNADHFVNISNVVYDTAGNPSHFIVCDTGDGRTKMVSIGDFDRAYRGSNGIKIDGEGCVVARKSKNAKRKAIDSIPPVPNVKNADFMLDFQQAFKIKNVERHNGKRYIYADAMFHG